MALKIKWNFVNWVDLNLYELTREERCEKGVEDLPSTLYNSASAMRDSELSKEALGSHIYSAFYEHKMLEWEDYRATVSEWELKSYLEKY